MSACVGALGAALVAMVCNLTSARRSSPPSRTRSRSWSAEAEARARRLEQLLQDDTTAYNGVIAAYRLPKETDEEKAARTRPSRTA